MSTGYTRLFRILFLVIFLKLLFLLALYFHSNDGIFRLQRRPLTVSQVDIFDEILVDRRETPSFEQRMKWIRKELPSFPLEELIARQNHSQADCGPLPGLRDIDFHNTYWQRAVNGNLTYNLFGAYYDDRETVPEAPLVRLLTMVNQHLDENFKYPLIYCQFWFKGRADPLIVPVSEHQMMWPFGKASPRIYPTFLSCPLPEDSSAQKKVPQMVSLVGEKCSRARNLLRVVYERDEQPEGEEKGSASSESLPRKDPRFIVCVKAMDFPYEDQSGRLIEWLELMRQLGASKVWLYNAQMHPNMSRVLKDYAGFVEVRPVSMGKGEPHALPHLHHYMVAADRTNRYLNEMIPYNDCFYRNMYKYDYVGVFDTDEVIMPLGNTTDWKQLVKLARVVPDYKSVTSPDCTEWVSFCFRNVYYPRYPERPKVFQNLSSSFYMLQHVERVRDHCNRKDAAKCFHDTRFAVGLHNHFTFFHTELAACAAKSVPIEFAQMQHYREPDTKSMLIDPIIDASIWRFQPQLQSRIEEKYRRLGFLPNEQQLADSLRRRGSSSS